MANLYMRFPGGKAKTVTLSYDDGVVYDIRLMEIMDKYGLKGTFNINAGLFKKEESDSDRRIWNSCLPTAPPMKSLRTDGGWNSCSVAPFVAWHIPLVPAAIRLWKS